MEPTTEPRAKRQKKDKGGRFAALQRLKDLKGSKNKYEVADVDNVYDTVDEATYSKQILQRQDEDWIVDDDGSGYVEDGREVFDDDLDAESIAQAQNENKSKKNKIKRKGISQNAGSKKNLQYLISNMPTKKEETKLGEDDVLSELINEIDLPNNSKNTATPTSKQRFSLLGEKLAAKEYMKSFSATKRKRTTKQDSEESVDEVDNEIVTKMHMDVDNDDNDDGTKAQIQIDKENQPENEPVEIKKKLLFNIDQEEIKKQAEANALQAEELAALESAFDDDFDDTTVMEASTSDNVTASMAEPAESFDELNFETNCEQFSLKASELPERNEEDGKNVFQFFWWDAYEDAVRRPGVVLLFGKTYSEEEKQFKSCCVVVQPILRKIYLLPHPYCSDDDGNESAVSIMDVYQEFNKFVSSHCHLKSYKSKKVTKHYAFDSNVPTESEYLEVQYQGEIDFENASFKTISQIFGVNSSFLEIFLLDRKIKGPCWLNVRNASKSNSPYSHTSIEMQCSDPSDVVVMQGAKQPPPPPLTVLTLNIKFGTTAKSNNEVALISCLVNKHYQLDKPIPQQPYQEHFCLVTKLSDTIFPEGFHNALTKYTATKVQRLDSERALLAYFLAQFQKIDPDLIVGYDMKGYQITLLAERLLTLKANNISRLSRLKRTNEVSQRILERLLFNGRLVCDTRISAMELIKCRSYDLDTLSNTVLKLPSGARIEIEPGMISKMYESPIEMFKIISCTMKDSLYILKIMYELNIIPLALQITNIAGFIMSRTLMGGRSERNEFLLLHAFHEKDYIVPEKYKLQKQDQNQLMIQRNTQKVRKAAAYSGGLVLEPKVGFYDKLVLLMDFNSLYPSIIQEYNICFTTIPDLENPDLVEPDAHVAFGILPTEIRKLVESRREVKKLMKNPDLSVELRMQYNIRQMALKLTANSMYGCLGFANSRFYAKHLAALITRKGREILSSTKDIAQKLSYDVIYGDTDSIMIHTNSYNYEEVFKIGKSIKQEINKMYKQVELDIDGVFKYLLLLKKKKYGAVTLSKDKYGKLVETHEYKGLDIVRRDWSQLASLAGRVILNQIFDDSTLDERLDNINQELQKIKNDIAEDGKLPLQLFVITKQLSKKIEAYSNIDSLPHVQVALRHNRQKGAKKFKEGDFIPYIICHDGTGNPPTKRGYLIEELINSSHLTVDKQYYLENQILPVVSRLVEPIEEIGADHVAHQLGIQLKTNQKQTKSYNNVQQQQQVNIDRLKISTRGATQFSFKCIGCKHLNRFTKYNKTSCPLLKCANDSCTMKPIDYIVYVKNQFSLYLRHFEQNYYLGEYTCEDPTCLNVATMYLKETAGKIVKCHMCNNSNLVKIMNERQLYAELLHMQELVTIPKADLGSLDKKLEAAYSDLKVIADEHIKHNSYGKMNLDLFELFIKNRQPADQETETPNDDLYMSDDAN